MNETYICYQGAYVAKNALPVLTLRLQGQLVDPVPPPREKLTIKINGALLQVIKAKGIAEPDPEDARTAGSSDFDEDLGSDDGMGDGIDEPTIEDGPDWMFDEGETTTKDKDYTFCPAPHRTPILHLFSRHFCRHPIFPERGGETQTAEQIRVRSVFEMYDFCKKRGLNEVWGYMWACWYSPKMWKLWSRSTAARLSRLRTTMNVENLWKVIKHEFLHNHVHPRLDTLVWILIHRVTRVQINRVAAMGDEHRLGRSKELSTFQKAFKANWKRLEKRTVSGKEYIVNVEKWLCTCGHQKYDPHHLCKHLVQAVPNPSAKFFTTIWRRRTVPIYRHRELVPCNADAFGPSATWHVDEGSVTDGDDHLCLGDTEVLRGNGGWKDLRYREEKVLGKRAGSPLDMVEGEEQIHHRSSSPVTGYGDVDEAVVRASFCVCSRTEVEISPF